MGVGLDGVDVVDDVDTVDGGAEGSGVLSGATEGSGLLRGTDEGAGLLSWPMAAEARMRKESRRRNRKSRLGFTFKFKCMFKRAGWGRRSRVIPPVQVWEDVVAPLAVFEELLVHVVAAELVV